MAQALHELFQPARVIDQFGMVERRAENGGMRHFAAYSASHAVMVHRRHGRAPERIGIGPDGERRAAGQPDAGMVARAGVGIHAIVFAGHALAGLAPTIEQGADAPLAVELALALGHDHLGAFFAGGHGFAQNLQGAFHVVRIEAAHPAHPHAAHRVGDRQAGLAARRVRFRRGHPLPAGGRGVAVIDNDGHAVVLVEHGVADAAG